MSCPNEVNQPYWRSRAHSNCLVGFPASLQSSDTNETPFAVFRQTASCIGPWALLILFCRNLVTTLAYTFLLLSLGVLVLSLD
jgi:hypothetical protein